MFFFLYCKLRYSPLPLYTPFTLLASLRLLDVVVFIVDDDGDDDGSVRG